MIFRRKLMPRNNEGDFIVDGLPSSFNNTYAEALIRYLNIFDPTFRKAKRKNEFQFILSLLRFRGMQPTDHDPYENSIETIDSIMKMEKKMKGKEKTNIFLWIYGHIIESSEPYEIIANLINILDGSGYNAWNFPKKKSGIYYRNLYPYEKIDILKSRAIKIGEPKLLEPIIEIFDRDLRNAVFHSDYGVTYEGSIILSNPTKIYTSKQILDLVNKSLAYHEVIKNTMDAYVEGYGKSKKIKVDPTFSPDPKERATILIRKGKGLIGMRSSWSKKQVSQGKIPWSIGNFLTYEHKYLNRDVTELPRSRVDIANNILSLLPLSIRKRLFDPVELLINKYG